MHVINFPDSAGLGCYLQQHSLYLGTYNAFTIPNYPHLHLGKKAGSICDTLTGINETGNFTNEKLNVYPNPATSKVTISNLHPDSYREASSKVTVTVYDVLGKEKLQHIYTATTDGKIEIDVNNFTNGIYFLQVMQDDSMWRSRFVKE